MRFLLVFVLLAVPAFAQQQMTPHQSAAQMLGSQLGLCFEGNATLQEQNIKLQTDLDAANKKIKELTDKK